MNVQQSNQQGNEPGDSSAHRQPAGSRRSQQRSIVAVWLLAVVGAVLTAVLSDPAERLTWIGLTLAGCTLATLSLQIAAGEKVGYVSRVTSSITGAVVVLAVATGIFALLGLGS
ncbi:hypothetical protein D6T64_17945 [Cryobacterium melibiosiphilum]|uniref:Uncharacterized protein n=1 Tax=Cryobacterium melibiosiphilum TaxID=995039 RepID=A0A3A5MM82_9MICO|nr:hypothetical protein [Cryobacterium melibiosiphilum]RJT86152.1 hypothetical protein D6T64_17945 [Cryobacterium melibiosiphilum]